MYAVLSLLFAFRFTRYPLNEAGAETAVYGYGWGVVLWFLPICLVVAAAGARQTEARKEFKARKSG